MNYDEFKKLKRGDIVRHLGAGDSYVVDNNDGKNVIGIRTINLSNPSEWVVFKPEPRKPREFWIHELVNGGRIVVSQNAADCEHCIHVREVIEEEAP